MNRPSWWFAFQDRKLLVKENGVLVEVPSVVDIAELELPEVRRQYLGSLNDQMCFSVELAVNADPPEGWKLLSLRRLYLKLPEELFVIAGRAIQIVEWEQTHQYCGRCGTQNQDKTDERAKECPQCGMVSYPRIAPAIIVLVENEDRLLLARAHRHPQGFYSVLAGFVEPGETLEEAVSREIREEVGIEVKDIGYFGSQPWPFPNSLMIAFTCQYAGGEIEVEEAEIEDAGWYAADELPPVPPKISIARGLIDWFVEKQLGPEALT